MTEGRRLLGLSGYMFDARYPPFLRALSLFHVLLPVVLVWMVHRLGYDPRAWRCQTVVVLIVLPLTYAITDPADNMRPPRASPLGTLGAVAALARRTKVGEAVGTASAQGLNVVYLGPRFAAHPAPWPGNPPAPG